MYKVECNTFLTEILGLNRFVFDAATGIGIYSHQGIDGDKVMEVLICQLDTNMTRNYT
jgi:hypothetical protein